MIAIKVQCGCGQRYAFDVEPVAGRMPAAVACPVCGADGTAVANTIIAQSLPPEPAVAPLATAAPRLAAPAPLAVSQPAPPPPPADSFAIPRAAVNQAIAHHGAGGDADTWKWWYYILAGICIAGYDIWRTWETGRIKYLGGLFLAVICIAIGIWDFQRKRKRSAGE